MPKRATVLKVAREVAVWAVTLMLVRIFLTQGIAKFSASSGWAHAFAGWGFPVWFRVLIGVVEVSAALLLLYPRTAGYGTILIALVMLGGMGTHVATGRPSQVTSEVVPLAFSLIVLAARRKRMIRIAGARPRPWRPLPAP